MQLDFNGIAQGYSVEKLASLFNDQNIDSYMIELGGEIKTKGKKKDGTYWKIGVDKPVSPDKERQLQAVLTLKNQSVATSGSYRKFYEQDGERFSHTIDPKTGKPVTHNLLSTTVVMDDCTLADAYATAFMVMGTDKTKEFLQSNPDLKMEVYLIYDEAGEFKTWMSEGMKKMTEEI
jgi:thiamine biosynthesis lipoprotein